MRKHINQKHLIIPEVIAFKNSKSIEILLIEWIDMQKLSHIEINEICKELGETYPKSIEQVHGGDIHSAWKVEFANKKLFLKINDRNKNFLEFEKY